MTTLSRLLLIDSRISDISGIVNATNERTCCLVFNYYHDTYETIISKLRFLNSNNRVIYDNFYYEEPQFPTQIDASNNHCTPCDGLEMSDIVLLPDTIRSQFLFSSNDEIMVTTTTTTTTPLVFFQRSPPPTHKPPLHVYINDLDEFYELGIELGETFSEILAFENIGIIQHAGFSNRGYKLVDAEPYYGSIINVEEREPLLYSWSGFITFIKSLFHLSTTPAPIDTHTLDLMACALYSDPNWRFIIDRLADENQITIRASLDNTGAQSIGGNWILEASSGTSESVSTDLTTVYFTQAINNWKYILGTYVDNRYTTLRFNGAMYATRYHNDLLNVTGSSKSFTIETWYYETTKSYNCTIVDKGNYNMLFLIRNQNLGNPQGLSFYNANMGWLYAESAVVPVQQWCHLAITRSGSTFKFFVNGVLMQTMSNSTSLYENNSTFAIGLQSPDSCSCNVMKSGCSMYNLRIWNVTRTDSQIQMFRNTILPYNTPNLVANYLLSDGTQTLSDRANSLDTYIQNYSSGQWLTNTVEIPNIGFLISNGYSLRTYNSTPLNAVSHFGDITYTDFSGVDLSGVNFANANMTGCNLTNANLTNANLTGASMIDVTLTGAITTGSTISSAVTTPSVVLTFDGTDDAVNVGIPTWTYSTQFRTTMTVECWFKTSDTSNQKVYTVLVGRNRTAGNSAESQFSINMASTGEIGFGLTNTADTGSTHTTSATYKDTNWHHVACTYNSATGVKVIYIDGVVSRTDTVSGFGLLSNNTSQKLIFGSDAYGVDVGGSDRQFRGSLSDVRIWNVVRSAADISNNYRQRLVGNETGLLGYWELNQGYGTGWSTYTVALDNTTNRSNGTLTNFASPSMSWALSNLYFRPRISNFVLGPNNGNYNTLDASFSFIDPSSNSLGDFTYSIDSSAVTLSNGAATRKTIYETSGAITIPTLTTYEFPAIAYLPDWQIDISFTVTGGSGTMRAIVGDMYNEINSGRGWGIWVSSSNRIQWSWLSTTSEPSTISVNLNTPYTLNVTQSRATSTITITLITVSSGASQTGSFSTGGNVIGKGPVTIGGWRTYNSENFPGTISYVNVSVPTNLRVVTLNEGTGGAVTVTATQGAYLELGRETQTASLTVTSNFSTFFQNITKNVLDNSFSLVVPVSVSTGAFSFTSSNTSVATINPATTINGLHFDGSQNYVDFSANITEFGKASFTIECWVKTSGTSMGLLNCQNGDSTWESGEKSLYIDASGIPAFVGFGNNWIYATTAVNDNAWHHIAVTWAYTSGTNGTAAIYIDGINQTSTVYTTYPAYAANNNNTGTFVFGKPNYLESTNFFNGTVSELRIWNVARSAAQIFQNYRRLLTGNEAGLVAYNRFNQGTAGGTNTEITTVVNNDLSGGFTGTLNGNFTLAGSTSNWVSGFSIRPENDVNIIGIGSSTITATQEATSSYSSEIARATLTVNRVPVTYQAISQVTKTFGVDISFSLSPLVAGISSSDGAYTFTTSSNAITINGTVATINAYTPSAITITASQAQTSIYSTGSTSISVLVNRGEPTLGSFVLGPGLGGYDLVDGSFVLVAPTSNSTGAFSYTSDNSGIAVITTVNNEFATSNLVARYDATNTSSYTLSGSNVTQWNDLTSNGYHFNTVWGNAPTLSTINGLQAIEFNSDKGMYRTNVPLTTEVTIFMVIRYSSSIGTWGNFMHHGHHDNDWSMRKSEWSSPYGKIGFHTNNDNYTVMTTLVDGMSYILIGRLKPAGNVDYWAYPLSGAPFILRDVYLTKTITSGNKTLYVGRSDSAEPCNGRIGEILYYNTAIPDSDISKNLLYLQNKWFNNIQTVSGTYVIFVSNGITNINAIQEASGNYLTKTVSSELRIGQPGVAPTLSSSTFTVESSKIYGDASFPITTRPTSNSSGAITYTSSNPLVATIDISGTVINVIGVGTVTFTATQARVKGYFTSATITSNTLTVARKAITIGALTLPANHFNNNSFILPRPTSTITSITTITTTVGVMVDPSDVNAVVYGNSWTKRGGDIDGEASNDQSGYSVAISADGTIIAIGGRLNDGSGNLLTDSGHVRVYRYNANKSTANSSGPAGWDQIGGDIDGEAAYDYSGTNVSLSADGTVIAIGANQNDGNGSSAGHVRIYKYNASKTTANSLGPIGWDKLGGDIDGEASNDQSGGNDWNSEGVKLSADGTIVAIGALYNNGNGTYSGHVRVYKYNASKGSSNNLGPAGWDKLGDDIDGEASYDSSGYAVSLSADGTVLAIGAYGNDATNTDAGHVRVYKYTPSKTVAVTNQTDASFGPIGWNRLGADIDGEAAYDRSGTGVSLSADGTVLAIGAHQNNSNTGHVRVYKYTPTKTVAVTSQTDASFGPIGWNRLGADIDGEAFGDYSGVDVALSADGTILAIAAYQNDGTATDAGHVRVYKYTPSKTVAVTNQSDASFGPIVWTRLGVDIDGEAANDWSGQSLGISADGTTLIIGARYNDGTSGNTSDNRGSARVYNISTTNTLSYTSSNSSIADIYGNLLMIKGVNGTTNITATQTGNTIYGKLDVAGTTYTLEYNTFTYTSSNTNAATVTTTGTVTKVGNGRTTFTASQPETRSYLTGSTTLLYYPPNQTNVDFSGVNLSNTDFTNFNFTNANLTNTNLTGSTFTGATMTNTEIVGANVTGITFSDTQKLQLRQNANNFAANIAEIALPSTLTTNNIVSIIPDLKTSDLINIQTINVLTPVNNSVTVTPNTTEGFYIGVSSDTPVRINGIAYQSTGSGANGQVVDENGTPVTFIKIGSVLYRVYAGSIIGIPVDPDYYKIKSYGLGAILTTAAIGSDSGNVGATGTTGPVGIAGVNGVTGPTGVFGYQGVTGSTGPQGATGAQGPTGVTGSWGVTGSIGLFGATGPTGPMGPTGSNAGKGNTGVTGVRGMTGPTGIVGAQGDYGITGNTGATGAIGATGPYGESVDVGNTGATGIYGVTGASLWRRNTDNIYYSLGRVGIQTSTAPGAVVNTQYLVDVGGNIKTTGIMNISDYRIKHDVVYLNSDSTAREILSNQIRQLRPVMFQNKAKNNAWEYGFIAHEVQEVFPELVYGIKDTVSDYQAISYHQMFAICCEEIKTLKSRIEKLESTRSR